MSSSNYLYVMLCHLPAARPLSAAARALTPRQLERDVNLQLSETETLFLLDVPQFAVQSGAGAPTSAAAAAGASAATGGAPGAADAGTGAPPPATPVPDATALSSAAGPAKPVEESEEVLIIRASNARYEEVLYEYHYILFSHASCIRSSVLYAV